MILILLLLLLLSPFPAFASFNSSEKPVISYIECNILAEADVWGSDLTATSSNADDNQNNKHTKSNGDKPAGGGRDGDDQKDNPTRGNTYKINQTSEDISQNDVADIDSILKNKYEQLMTSIAEIIFMGNIAQESGCESEHGFEINKATKNSTKETADPKETTPPPPSMSDDLRTVVLSNEQVKQQARTNPENITFIENGMKLVIPTRSLTELLPEDLDQFKVSMTYNGFDRFQIIIFINGTEVTDFIGSEFTVYIPWEKMTGSVYCYQIPDQNIPAVGYENNFLLFNLAKTGEYQIAGDTPKEPLPQAKPKTLIVPSLIAISLLSGMWIVISKGKNQQDQRQSHD